MGSRPMRVLGKARLLLLSAPCSRAASLRKLWIGTGAMVQDEPVRKLSTHHCTILRYNGLDGIIMASRLNDAACAYEGVAASPAHSVDRAAGMGWVAGTSPVRDGQQGQPAEGGDC